MQKIAPFTNAQEALSTLDNGGRFYNFLTHAQDGKIEPSELAKVAGVISDKQQMALYLDLAIDLLDENDSKRVLGALTEDLLKSYQEYLPQRFTPSQASQEAISGKNAIITGVPKYIESNTDFVAFIMFPISTGSTTTFTMIPIFDQYDVYQVRDEADDKIYFIAHARTKEKLPEITTKCAGIVKVLTDQHGQNPKQFLEMKYYYEVGNRK